MVWSRLLRRERRTPTLPLPGPCWARRHTLRAQRHLLYTPETELDIAAAMAAGSDPEAQHWLGRTEDTVLDERVREAVLDLRPGDPDALSSSRVAQLLLSHPFTPRPDEGEVLVAVRLDDGRYAGATTLHLATGQTGGWPGPRHGTLPRRPPPRPRAPGPPDGQRRPRTHQHRQRPSPRRRRLPPHSRPAPPHPPRRPRDSRHLADPHGNHPTHPLPSHPETLTHSR